MNWQGGGNLTLQYMHDILRKSKIKIVVCSKGEASTLKKSNLRESEGFFYGVRQDAND